MRRKTTTMFGGFIVEQAGLGTQLPGAGGVPPFGTNKGPDANRNLVVELEPGIFPKLPPGLDVKFSQPTDVGGNYLAWMQQQLRDIAKQR